MKKSRRRLIDSTTTSLTSVPCLLPITDLRRGICPTFWTQHTLGPSATLAFYDTETRALRVALTGNSRAILGRRGRAGESYRLEVLSADQDATNAEELARVKREHPGKR